MVRAVSATIINDEIEAKASPGILRKNNGVASILNPQFRYSSKSETITNENSDKSIIV